MRGFASEPDNYRDSDGDGVIDRDDDGFVLPLVDIRDTTARTPYTNPETFIMLQGERRYRFGSFPLLLEYENLEGEFPNGVASLAMPWRTYVPVGGQVTIDARYVQQNGFAGGVGALGSWGTGAASVATVDAAGVVTGVMVGTTTITVSYAGLTAIGWVNVGLIMAKRTITQPADGADFIVSIGMTMPNNGYSVVATTEDSSGDGVIIECPNGVGDRTTTTFRCRTSTPLVNGAVIDFVITP